MCTNRNGWVYSNLLHCIFNYEEGGLKCQTKDQRNSPIKKLIVETNVILNVLLAKIPVLTHSYEWAIIANLAKIKISPSKMARKIK